MKLRSILFFIVFPIVVILLLCFLCSSLFVFAYFSGRGSGNVIREDREIDEVESVTFHGQGNLHIIQGDEYNLEIEAEDNIVPKITTDVEDNNLEIGYTRRYFWPISSLIYPTKNINIYLTVVDINKITLDGANSVYSDNLNTETLDINLNGASKIDLSDLYVDELNIKASGASTINIEGSVMKQNIKLDGASTYKAIDLNSEECIIEISGSGKAEVNATKSLEARINGAGKITYSGDPEKVEQDINGVGKIEPK